jgi:endonuclease VIII
MPEGHLLHRFARDQAEMLGHPVRATSPQGRFAGGAAALDGRELEAVEAYGKHLHHRFAGPGPGLHTHLGMQGKWIRLAGDRPPRPQVRLRLAAAAVAWDLIAPGTCELVDQPAWEELVRSLGPDPLVPGAGEERAWKAVASFPGTVGAALMDQGVIAGVGNVLRAETLFRAGVHPSRPAADLDRSGFDRIWEVLVELMARSADEGQILPDGRMVYKQPACRACGTPVQSWSLAGRTAYACPRCQPG